MRRLKVLEWLLLLTIAIGAGPATSKMWQWSTTAASNAGADPSINWAEGMSPSSVNDSARAMMAVLAAWRNDISATNTTAGTSTAFTLTTSEGVATTPSNGQMISFIVHTTNGASPTLSVDGGTVYPIWLNGSVVPSGTLVGGSPYRVAFSNSNSAWLLESGFASPFSIPLGGIMWSTSPTAPNSSFIAPSGQCISTTTYASYWVQQGSPASGACPGGQFAVIDMRGRVGVALDTLNASAALRLTNSATGCGTAMTSIGAVCANGAESTTLATANLPPYTPSGNNISGSATFGFTANNANWSSGANSTVTSVVSSGGSTVPTTFTQPTFVGNAQGGINTPLPRIMPSIGLIPYLRII